MKLKKKLTDCHHDISFTTPEFNKLKAEVFDARLGQASLVTKTDFGTKLIGLNEKISTNKTKHLLVENELKNCKHFTHFILEAKDTLKKIAHKII